MEKIIHIGDIGWELPGILQWLWTGAAGEEGASGVMQAESVSDYLRTTRIYAVVDSNVAGRFAPALKAADIEWMPFVAQEERKSLEGLQEIVGWLLEREADRGALLLGIGGGVTTDITAFAASVYKRGIRYALIPTTLLAQVDAAVGGKTGVNFYGYKNVIGTFGVPEAVIIAPQVLGSLPAKEWRSGMAEVLKTLIIGDAKMYGKAVGWYGGILVRRRIPGNEAGVEEMAETVPPEQHDAETLGLIIRRCIGIKSSIVKADRTEKGERMKLNLGHTIGHAVESVCLNAGRPVTHGEAVAAGIIAAAGISLRKGVLAEDVAGKIVRDFKSLGYRDVPEILKACADVPEGEMTAKLTDFVLNDKKCKEDFINFVLIRSLGFVEAYRLSVNEIQEVLNDLY
ncbi:MAG TPA: 3-dehydroquinate synthase [Candidatus Coprenecus pullistercoris]|nr:3-dehydroquinate synthase [Candidatus Coprenecus pullistercoris]